MQKNKTIWKTTPNNLEGSTIIGTKYALVFKVVN
jgi:hypothetical protein